jgi:hypothetical protein
MSVGEVYQLVLHQAVQGEGIESVFHYLQVGGGPGSENATNLDVTFVANVLPLIQDVLAGAWSANGSSVVNLGTPSDFAEITYTPNYNGTRMGDVVSPVVTWSFRLNRIQPGQRSGWKRFSGISEDDVSGFTPDPGVSAALGALSAILPVVLAAAEETWRLVVVKRPIILGTNPPVYYIVPAADFRGVGSQVSRKLPFVS